ncbi:DUF6864 domain-containing function [Pseudomonas syringae]|uniref:DUF6864 domain-containing function n=1 Tax=Pseudomonas syringae TaxID=317 RepID=UPI0034D42501
MKIRAGGREVIASGIVHSKGREPTEFELDKNMTLRVEIVEDKSSPPGIELLPEAQVMVVRFTNPSTVLNFGFPSQVLLGKFNHRDLYAQLRVNVFGDFSSYDIAYSFYSGE